MTERVNYRVSSQCPASVRRQIAHDLNERGLFAFGACTETDSIVQPSQEEWLI